MIKVKSNSNNFIYFFPISLFFLMMFLPATYQEIKYVLLAFTMVFGLLFIYLKKFSYSISFIFWFFTYISFYLIWIIIGVVNNNPGTLDYFRVQVLWPFIFLILLGYINSIERVYSILKILIITSFIISIYNIYKVLSVMGFLPPIYNLHDDFEVGIHSGFTQIVTLNIGSLIFLVPFMFGTSIFNSAILKKINLSKSFLLIALIISLICGIMSGRRVIWLNIILSPIIIVFMLSLKKQNHNLLTKFIIRIAVAFLLLFFLVTIFNDRLDINYHSMKNRFMQEFNSTKITPRQEQKNSLINHFYENPIIGTGFGIGVKDVVRSSERPWTYELTYHLFLYNTGIIGITIFFSLLLSPIIWGIRLLRKTQNFVFIITPILTGYISAIIANATNPYFTSSFDYEWMLFLPVGIFSCLELTKEQKL